MYSVTEEYNEAMEKPVRNRSWIKIDFGITDPDAPAAATATDNGHLSYSNTAGVVIGATSTSYATLEHNRWILDGKNQIPLSDNPIYQGYVGNEISNAQNVWSVQPKLDCVFSDYFTFPGLSFYFDMSMDEYPSEFRIQAFHNGELVYDVVDEPTDAYWVHEEQIPICDRLLFTWIKSVRPYRRARLSSLVFGVGMSLTEEDIESCSVSKEIDLLSTKFPKNDFDFTIFDTEKRYDPENPAGVWEYLESRQAVNVSIGYSLDDDSIEWIPWTHAYTSGSFNVSGSDAVTLVTINCVGLIEHLTQRYDTSVYYPNGRSLYDLAYDVINAIGFSNVIEVDTALRDIITHVPLPSGQANEVLQLIANAGRCTMNHTRGGVLQIVRDTPSEPIFELDFSKMLEKPNTSKTAPLRDLTTSYHPVSISTEKKEIVSSQRVEVVGGTAPIVFNHEAAVNQTVTVSSGLTMGTPIYYAYKTVVPLSGSGTVTIKANTLEFADIEYTKRYSDVGEDLTSMKNELIDNYEDCAAYADWVANIVKRRNYYKVTDRGYPQLDTGDSITFTSNFLNEIVATVTKQKISFNGAITGEGEYTIGGDE